MLLSHCFKALSSGFISFLYSVLLDFSSTKKTLLSSNTIKSQEEIASLNNPALNSSFCFKTKNGVDSVVVNIESSSGDSFTNGDIETFLTAQLDFGTQLVNKDDTIKQYYYVWKKDGTAMKQIATSFDGEGNPIYVNNPVDNIGDLSMFKEKTIFISSKDIDTKNIFSCLVYDNEIDAFNEYKIDNEVEWV